jgi:hypothetical protein
MQVVIRTKLEIQEISERKRFSGIVFQVQIEKVKRFILWSQNL